MKARGEALWNNKNLPLEVRALGQQLMIPLHLERKKVATLTAGEMEKASKIQAPYTRLAERERKDQSLPFEGRTSSGTIPFEAKEVGDKTLVRLPPDNVRLPRLTAAEIAQLYADQTNALIAQKHGIDVADLPDDEKVSPGDVTVLIPGMDIWRAQKPGGKQVIGTFTPGKGIEYDLVTDNLLWNLMARPDKASPTIEAVGQFFGAMNAPGRRLVTRSFSFVVNNFVRDPGMAMLWGRVPIPWYYHAYGLLGRLGVVSTSEVRHDAQDLYETMARGVDETLRHGHRKLWESFKDHLREGVAAPHNWDEMGALRKFAMLFPRGYAAAAKPFDVALWGSGLAWLSNTIESLAREGAYMEEVRHEGTPAQARLYASQITGYFSERAGNPSAAELMRIGYFVNPWVQIMHQMVERGLDPDPRVKTRFYGRLIPLMAATGAAAAAVNWMMMSDDDKKKERERPLKSRLSSFVMNGVRLPFPHGFHGGITSGAYNFVLNKLLREDVDGWAYTKNILRQMKDMPDWTAWISNPLKTALELSITGGYNFHRDSPIVPGWMQQAEPEEQYFPDTPATYIWAGDVANVSPLKLRHFIRSMFGTIADSMLTSLGEISEKGVSAQTVTDAVLSIYTLDALKAHDPKGYYSRSVDEMQELDKQWDVIQKRIKYLMEREDTLTPEDKVTLGLLVKQQETASTLHFAMLAIERKWREAKDARKNGDLELVEKLELEMVDLARKALGKEPQ